ncbi:MAG: nucleotidyltransferase domain-containing protein [Spirochaetaceae bacterium]|nr:MAG: nucleotidyltransferase domain-containing protein [Spirochaetaceae bacterium]
MASITDAVTDTGSRDTRVLAFYLLGSAAQNRLRHDSDVDIALMPMPGTVISSIERAGIAHALSYRLRRTVDLGELSTRNLVYANEVLHTGALLYSKDPAATALVAANLLGLYLEFNERRQEVTRAFSL